MRIAAVVLALVLASMVTYPARARPWRVLKDHWSAADEKGFGAFVSAIGNSNCSSSESCLRNAANPYRDTDQAFVDIDVDCAKLPYLLRAYYAWKNGLPFSYVDTVSGYGGDFRYAKSANRPVGRHDIIDSGNGIDGPIAIRIMLSHVFSGTYRTDPRDGRGILSDFYSPELKPGSIRPGTVIYDVNGHVGVVYKIDAGGRIYYLDAHPDFTVSRSVYGAQFGQSPLRLGGGFKNWRPFRLVHARVDVTGNLVGGHMVYARNDQIPDFSLVQYLGTEPNPSEGISKARFVYNGEELGFYEYVRGAVSGGRMDFNPIYELKATIKALCNDLNDRAQYVDQAVAEELPEKPHPSRLPDNIYGSDDSLWESYATPSRDVRLKAAFAQFYNDMARMIDLWIHRDPRIVYDGQFLKQDLEEAYDKQSNACTITYLSSDKHPVPMTFDDMVHRLFTMSFDPYDCIELRWGAEGDEAKSCIDGAAKLAWYKAEQRLRDQVEPAYDLTMDYSIAELEAHHIGTGVGQPPNVDVKSLIDGMGDQVSFRGMAPVGR